MALRGDGQLRGPTGGAAIARTLASAGATVPPAHAVARIRLGVLMTLRAVGPVFRAQVFRRAATDPCAVTAPAVAAAVSPGVLRGELVPPGAVGLTGACPAVPDSIRRVALGAVPAQVGEPVIQGIVVFMAARRLAGRRFPPEREQDKPVHGPVPGHVARGKAHRRAQAIPGATQREFQHPAAIPAGPDLATQAMDSPIVADLVQTLIPGDGQPALMRKVIHVGPVSSGSAMPPGRTECWSTRGRGGPFIEKFSGNRPRRWAA